MKFYLDSIGCRLNQSEIEKFGREIRRNGHQLTARPEEADLAIVNTCAVTAKASSDSRTRARQLGKRTREGVVLTGCWSTLDVESALALPNVLHVVPNAAKPGLIQSILTADQIELVGGMLAREPLPGLRSRTRAFIKVQDGCDLSCTFCVTTIARGAGRSLPIAQIIDDIHYAQRGGAKEVVLTGVHLGSWGQDMDPMMSLEDLIFSILSDTDIQRLRLSSLEPWDLDEGFFSLWQDPRLCRHLPLPLQSGSDAILRRMGRRTTTQDFAELVSSARSSIPGVAITTDIIAGFPGETPDDFLQTLEFIRSLHLAGGHIFTYSERKGTPAARFPKKVPNRIRTERSSALRKVISESRHRYYRDHLGSRQPVLWEAVSESGPDGLEIRGWTDNYIRVHYTGQRNLSNEITHVILSELNSDGNTVRARHTE